MRDFHVYNTLSRKKELFKPLHEGHVGIYVCGPTVYGDPHLGHARSAITFDVLTRYLRHLGYRVRYVRNITDVGHLENDADEGDDKIAKKARLEQLEPMEVVQYYTNRYHDFMRLLNVLPPNIEPHASGHVIEQIELIKKILEQGYAYEINGSVYFDVEKYNKTYTYGKLSGRTVDEQQANTRKLDGQDDKRQPFDFALWKKASPEHIMRWPSPWSDGFPGWHLECSAMSTKYLGETFDIHGGGMDLLFPHHECEIAQSTAVGHNAARYWMHNNMITNSGQKMSKSLQNFITLEEMFAGTHQLLAQAYTPMTVRFFMLQAHYSSTLDFSNETMQAAEKVLKRILEAANTLSKLTPSAVSTRSEEITAIVEKCYEALSDDLNTSLAIAHLQEAVRIINSANDKKDTLTAADIDSLKALFSGILFDSLGIADEQQQGVDTTLLDGLIQMILETRNKAKANKDFAVGDKIRNDLLQLGIAVKDTKEGSTWTLG
ncbi:MAG: cysteine--tRNA ligase [Bacteroidales bacterium]|nr:cysteine--tRNA ligase [Bacteroidales bacterium]MCL2133074.1 cysteine--tRNA ligase [Bacteroidales bacterium]